MAYASGGLIQATDYNGLAQTTAGGNVAYVWGVGSSTWGYGQSTSLIASVSTGGTVTAVQWAGLVYTTNAALAHQGQTQIGGGLGGANINMTAGQTITYFSNVAAAVTQVNTTRATAYAQGTTTTGSNYGTAISFTDTSSAAQTSTITRTVTFASADQARYFFNAGGQINVVVNTPTGSNGTSHSADFVTLWGTNLTGITIKGTTTSYSGSGGTVSTNNTGLGYWNMSTSAQVVAKITSANSTYVYDGDYVYIAVNTNGLQGSHSDNGSTITVTFYTYCSTVGGNSHFNNTVGFTHNAQINVVYPETTYLTNTWGTVTIS